MQGVATSLLCHRERRRRVAITVHGDCFVATLLAMTALSVIASPAPRWMQGVAISLLGDCRGQPLRCLARPFFDFFGLPILALISRGLGGGVGACSIRFRSWRTRCGPEAALSSRGSSRRRSSFSTRSPSGSQQLRVPTLIGPYCHCERGEAISFVQEIASALRASQ